LNMLIKVIMNGEPHGDRFGFSSPPNCQDHGFPFYFFSPSISPQNEPPL
jgi:hypothetical protein